ncbi:39S ribosomal protein L46, mitochondrial-like [Asterias rubens]|uniref:39S ribosomal protein L46, mitochondrial-like n=1 Tax=Asterias rubens TaxID=7604 RepID=UPI001454EDB8|nr:39S ribosomal protein L46, mitochondrial-like [Asterias rubens]
MAAPSIAIFRHLSFKCLSVTSVRAASSIPRLPHHRIRKSSHPRCRYSSSVPSAPSESKSPRWDLMSAVCLERYPVVSQELTQIETEYMTMQETVELENSLLSSHEMQVIQDKERIKRRQSGLVDDDEDDQTSELISALDMEDRYMEEFNQFKPASCTSDIDDPQSLQRKLMDKLVLLVKCKVGDKSMWMMPQGARQEGETMRETAGRVLASQCSPQSMRDMRAHFFGNAPSACFKYSYPLDMQRKSGVKGAKIFFYKARLMTGDVQINKNVIEDYAWVAHSEMDKYVVPSYLETVQQFVVPVSLAV